MPEYSGTESTFAHDCAGKRLWSLRYKNENLMNPASKDLLDLWQDEVHTVTAGWGGSFDAIFDDVADWVGGATGVPCNFDQAAWTAATNAMIANLGAPVIYNGLSARGPNYTVGPAIGLNETTLGGMYEGCYSAAGPFPKPHGGNWTTIEDTEIQMARSHKLFVCEGLHTTDASSSIDLRAYMLASYLLTYDPATTALREHFLTPSGFEVFPEAKLVALNPLIPRPEYISGLLQPSGVYGREYAACYIAGHYVGGCAALVNNDPTSTKAFPWPGKYTRTLLLSGAGILDGGTISASGPSPPHIVPKLGAVIAFR